MALPAARPRRYRRSVALQRVADFDPHHRNAGQLRLQAGTLQILVHRAADIGDDLRELRAVRHAGVERQHDQRQIALFGQQLAPDQLVALHAL